jgi:acid phosphatase
MIGLRPSRRTARPTALGSLLLAFGCGAARSPDTTLNAVLWVQSSAEYEAAAVGIYAVATRVLELGRADSSWTAATEQEGDYRRLPPAVILDVDETVLDNTPYQARLLEDGELYGPVSWGAWVAEAQAPAIPGALEFTRTAAGTGVTVFYVTNRDSALEDATRANLHRLGFPLAQDTDVILTRGERPEWGSDKSTRRAYVAQSFRIVLLVGDDLNDFVAADRASVAERSDLVGTYRANWGTRWIVLPNPMYGSWERSLIGDADLSEDGALRVKRRGGKAARPPPEQT